jgi:hypothetical protein
VTSRSVLIEPSLLLIWLYISTVFPSREADACHRTCINNMLYGAEVRLEITRNEIGRNHEAYESVRFIFALLSDWTTKRLYQRDRALYGNRR